MIKDDDDMQGVNMGGNNVCTHTFLRSRNTFGYFKPHWVEALPPLCQTFAIFLSSTAVATLSVQAFQTRSAALHNTTQYCGMPFRTLRVNFLC